MRPKNIKSLLALYSKKDLNKFDKIKKSLPTEVHIHDPKELTEEEIKQGKVLEPVNLSELNPEFIYDKKHDMLYHRIAEGCYKHVA